MHQVLEQLRHVDGLADRADLLFALHTHARERYGSDAAGVLWWLANLYRDTATALARRQNAAEAR